MTTMTQPKSPTIEYWQAQASRAIAEREQIKRSLEAAEGPAAYWRREAKGLSQKLAQTQVRYNSAKENEIKARRDAIGFSEQADAIKKKQEGLRLKLWDIWSGLDDGEMKQKLWELWIEF